MSDWPSFLFLLPVVPSLSHNISILICLPEDVTSEKFVKVKFPQSHDIRFVQVGWHYQLSCISVATMFLLQAVLFHECARVDFAMPRVALMGLDGVP